MNDDSTTLQNVRRFLYADKPSNINQTDVLQIVCLMLAKAEDHDVFHSQQTLARMCGTDTRTIARSQRRLVSSEVDWLARVHNRGKTSSLTLKYQNIPGEEIICSKITPDAQRLAFEYQRGLQRRGRKKFPKQWLRQQAFSAQRILNACDGDIRLAAKLITHSLDHPQHCKKARQSLYHICGRWKKILATYSEDLQMIEQAQRQGVHVQRPEHVEQEN